MPEDMLKFWQQEQINATSEKPDALLQDKQDILQALWKDKNDIVSLQKLENTVKPIQESIDQKAANDILQNLWKDKIWIRSLNMSFEDFIKHSDAFIWKKILSWEDVFISDLKTYIESKNNIVISKDVADKQDVNIANDKIDINKALDEKLRFIDKILEAKKSEIISQPTYQFEKTAFEQQVWAKVDDAYFVTRFALGHVWEPNAYLTQADLWGMKQEDLIARLNEKYNVREVISLQDKNFQNSAFDGRVSGMTRQEIATKWWSFETVFTAAELEFYKQDSQLRSNLHWLVQSWMFPGAKSVGANEQYWNWDKDATNWIPKNALQNDQTFSQWMEKNKIPTNVQNAWKVYYDESFKSILNKPQNELTTLEKNQQAMFLQNIASVEATAYRNTVQESTTKIIAENLFADIAAMTWKDVSWASDWKLLKSSTGDYFSMDADWNTKMNYTLNGVQWDISIDKNGVVTMWPVLWQEAGYSDLIAKKRQVWKILWVTSYIGMVDKIVAWNWLRAIPTDDILTQIRSTIKHDVTASEITKATMQTNIARQAMMDTILTKTNSPRTIDIKANLSSTSFSNKPLVTWIDTNDYSRLLLSVYGYSTTSSKSQIESVTNAYNSLQQYLIANPTFSENINLKNNPEHLASILNKFPIEKWGDVKIMWEKKFKEEKAQMDIDNELSALEQKIDGWYI